MEIKESKKNYEKDFKVAGSRREELTETRTTQKVWLIENGTKIKQVDEFENFNDKKRLIDAGTEANMYQQLELQAIKYVQGTIIPSYEAKTEAWGSEELWREMIYNAIHDQSIRFLGEIVAELKRQSASKPSLNWCESLAKWLMEKLEIEVVSRYSKEREENKRIFKDRIKSNFPESNLLKRL